MRLKDKVAIITGGGTGIGRGIALEFGKQGAKVIVCGRREEPLKQTIETIEKNGGEAIYQIADISKSDQIKSMVDMAIERFGKIDILVNNAGIFVSNDVHSLDEEEWDKVMDIDAKGVFLTSKAVIPQMLSQQKGKIINISSIAGLFGFEKSAAYCAAKGAVVNLTREMALDYASKGINVNAIAPGVIESDMTDPFLKDEASRNDFLSKIPAGRVGKPEDIANICVYLASNESDYMTGQTLVVDGGWTIK